MALTKKVFAVHRGESCFNKRIIDADCGHHLFGISSANDRQLGFTIHHRSLRVVTLGWSLDDACAMEGLKEDFVGSGSDFAVQ